MQKIKLVSLEPPLDAILRRLGYSKHKTQADSEVLNDIRQQIIESMSYIHPIAHVEESKILIKEPDMVALSNGLVIESVKVANILAPCRSVSLIVCTIGSDVGDIVRGYSGSGEMAKSVVWDAIGSEAVEAFAEYIHEVLRQKYTMMGYESTIRYAPGYGDLPTSVHEKLLPLMEAESIGIRYDAESYLLMPEKSISALIGWKRKE